MRIAWWAIFVSGCSAFQETAAPNTSDGGVNVVAPGDAAPADASAEDAGADSGACAVLFQETFAQSPLSGWTGGGTSKPAIGSVNGIARGPMPVMALRAMATSTGSTGNSGAFVNRTALSPTQHVRATFDFAYAALDVTAAVGCTLDLKRESPLADARIMLGIDVAPGFEVTGGLMTDMGAITAANLDVSVTQPPAKTWVPIVLELEASADGTSIARRATIDGTPATLPSFAPQTATGEHITFDEVYVACGIVGAYASQGGTANVDVYMKNLVVTACP